MTAIRVLSTFLAPTLFAWTLFPQAAVAVESATGVYLLGSKTSLAGVTPPPGTYLNDTVYLYSGSADKTIVQSGILTTGIEADVALNLASSLTVLNRKVLDGFVGFGIIVPTAWKRVSADAEISLPAPFGTELRRNFTDEDFRFGDPLATAMIGWNKGPWHWNLQTLVNIPVGFWERRNLSNVGFNRWAVDTTAAVTWLRPDIGFEISTAAGFTFNGENSDTDYNSGTEFHVEWAAVRNLSKQLSIGVAGYHYEQVTGDSGAGARLGDFQGRVTAIGVILNYSFTVHGTPISTGVRYFHEMKSVNRLDGDAALLTVTFPLSR